MSVICVELSYFHVFFSSFFSFYQVSEEFPSNDCLSLCNCDCVAEELAYINSIFSEESSMDTKDTDREMSSDAFYLHVQTKIVLTCKGN